MRSCFFRLVLTALLLASISLPVNAQGSANSSLSGVVMDQSGGVIPGADIVVKNDATGAEYKTLTAENGTF